MLDEHNFTSYIDLECINDPNGYPPIWNPPYDHDINPFPPCVPAGKQYTWGLYYKTFHGSVATEPLKVL